MCLCSAFSEAGLQVGSGFTARGLAAFRGVCDRDKPIQKPSPAVLSQQPWQT